MTSYLIILKFYYVIIYLKDYKLANHTTSDHQDEKSKLSNIFTKIISKQARM